MDYHYDAVVDNVHDGDSVTLSIDLGFSQWWRGMHIRLFGINAPELSTPEGKASLAYLQTLLKPGAPVLLESIKDKADKYGGRYLGVLYLPGELGSINDRMVASGHAVVWDGQGPKPV